MDENMINEAKRVLEEEASALMNFKESIPDSFIDALRLINTTRENKGKIIITGMGKSGIVAKKIASTFSSIGTPSIYLHPADALHGDTGMISDNDLCIAISKSGNSEEMGLLMPAIKHKGLKLISIVNNAESDLAKNSDIVINLNVEKEACPLNLAPTTSSTLTMAVGDALASCLLKLNDFKKEDFALLHPGGTLGRSLILKVKDLMTPKEETAILNEDSTLKEVFFEMTDKKTLGCIVDSNNKLCGVVSDGDLRRAGLMYDDALLHKTAKEVMTRNPKVIHKDDLAINALKMMEENSITTVLVYDDDKTKIEGVIYIHQILNAKLK